MKSIDNVKAKNIVKFEDIVDMQFFEEFNSHETYSDLMCTDFQSQHFVISPNFCYLSTNVGVFVFKFPRYP